MTILNGILAQLGSIAGQLATSIVPGAGAAIKAGEAILAAFNVVKEANGGTAPADAEAQHQALLEKVNAHADATLGRAEGAG